MLSLLGRMRGSATSLGQASSRAFFDGHSIQLKTIVSSSFASTARRKSVTFPLGAASPQPSTTRNAPYSSNTLAAFEAILMLSVAIGGWNRDNEAVGITGA